MSVNLLRGGLPDPSHWTLADLGLERIEHDKVRGDWLIYCLLAAASFVETAADLYTRNLVEHFPDPRARAWLRNRWQPEELQHGRALRAYVESAWPEVRWEIGYSGFFEEYSKLCTMDELEPSRALEMVARCVVETGTATFYTALHRRTTEPVLKRLTGLIRRDEVRHYNYFRSFFEAYRQEERVGRVEILRAVLERFTEVESEDAQIGLKHAWIMRHPGQAFQDERYQEFLVDARELIATHYPYRMALQMLLQPLSLNRTLQRLSLPLLEGAARRMMLS
jgi:rubrerythrin